MRRIAAMVPFILLGCTDIAEIRATPPAVSLITRYEELRIDIACDASVKANLSDCSSVREQLHSELQQQLEGVVQLQGSGAATHGDAANLQVVITELRYTSEWARLLFGVSAGPAVLHTTLTLTDTTTKRVLWQANTVMSSRGGGVWETSTPRQVEMLAAQVSRELPILMSSTAR